MPLEYIIGWMKTYVIIAISGLLIFAGGFYFLYHSFSKTVVTPSSQSEAEIVGQLNDAGKAQYKSLNNAEFEEQAIPLNDEAMSKI